jgi:hypothetical protein
VVYAQFAPNGVKFASNRLTVSMEIETSVPAAAPGCLVDANFNAFDAFGALFDARGASRIAAAVIFK